MINTKEIKKLLIDKDITVKELAERLGKSYSNVMRKINNKISINLCEAEKIQDILDIQDRDFGFYFFSHERDI